MSALILPGASIPMTWTAGPPERVCSTTNYATDGLAIPLLPFPSWVLAVDAYYPLPFTSTGSSLFGRQVDPDPTHLSPFTMQFWTDLPDTPGAILLYNGGPGTPATVPLDFQASWLLGQNFVDLQVRITRKDLRDPATYYATSWSVCVPVLPLAPPVPPPGGVPPGGGPPPSTVPLGAPALAEIQFHQMAKSHPDAYAHAALGASIDVTWARRYMTARRLWVRGVDLVFAASVAPVAQIATLGVIAAALPATTATGNTRHFQFDTAGAGFDRGAFV